MAKLAPKKEQALIDSLKRVLQNDTFVTAEELAEQLQVGKGSIHKAFTRIQREPGWSFTPSNHTPYGRQRGPNWNRGRSKGDRYIHDRAEPDWERTFFRVRKPA